MISLIIYKRLFHTGKILIVLQAVSESLVALGFWSDNLLSLRKLRAKGTLVPGLRYNNNILSFPAKPG
jgi:hypothetical protein